MSEETKPPLDSQGALKLKLPEPAVSVGEPWVDDVLERQLLATKLTNLIRNQSAPLVISIHGYWGTGKTFLLKRWQKDLESQNSKAIYFNAWEDDFCDDPLVAIIGQVSGYFKDSSFKSFADKVTDVAIPLLWQNIRSTLERSIGITLALDQVKNLRQDPLESYLSQRAKKDELKSCLTELSAKVRDETGHPMVFIIDELDRCRPTFAIELLERVKHIFDVPDLVFVIGINRDELSRSLLSIYGNIDSDVYLRRFFDIEFALPEVDAEKFGKHLMQKYGLSEFFDTLSKGANSNVHAQEFGMMNSYLPALWGRLGLSLRDIDHCVRMIALVGKNLKPRFFMYPWLLGLLVTLKIKNSSLYRQFIQGACLGSEVMDYIDNAVDQLQEIDRPLARTLSLIEAYLYMSESGFDDFGLEATSALRQLQLLKKGECVTHSEYLSKKTQGEGSQKADKLLRLVQDLGRPESTGNHNVVGYLASLIDLHQEDVRR